MTKEQILEYLEESYPDFDILLADGYEEAFLGIANQFDRLMAVYDKDKCIEILMRDMSEDDAYEYFEFNVAGSYAGENTPAFIVLKKD